jgi:hypothetical protein
MIKATKKFDVSRQTVRQIPNVAAMPNLYSL